jgi:zinc protease
MQLKKNNTTAMLCLAIIMGMTSSFELQAQVVKHNKKASTVKSERVFTLDSAVKTGTLPNGFTYFIRRNTEPAGRALFYLVNKVGSVLEQDNQRGLAHFMEHMNFNGTKNFPKNELIHTLEKAGVRFGADLNAYTSFDETVYQIPIATTDKAVLDNTMLIMRDWAQNALLETEEINKERGVILEEKRLAKGVSERIKEKILPVMLNHSRYADRLPIGTDEVLNNFDPVLIRSFYQDWYRPDLQALIIVGDVDIEVIEKKIKALFSDLKNPVNQKERTNYNVDLKGENHFLLFTDPELTSSSLQVMVKMPKLEMRTTLDYKKSMIQSLFNQIMAKRMAKLSSQPVLPYITGSVSQGSIFKGVDAYTMAVDVKPVSFETGFKTIYTEVLKAHKFGFTKMELQLAKENYRNSLENAIKEKNKTDSASFMSEYVQYFLDQTAAPGIDKEYAIAMEELPTITLNEINKLAVDVMNDKNRDIIILAPEKEKASVPTESDLIKWAKEQREATIIPNQEELKTTTLMAVKPKPGKIVSETQNKQVGLTEIKLSNGVRVVLKSTDFSANEIIFASTSEGGTSLYSNDLLNAASKSASLIAGSGVANFDMNQLREVVNGKTIGVNPYISERNQGFSGFSSKKDLETALQLLYLYATEPRKDSILFNNLVVNSKLALAHRNDSPEVIFSDTINGVLTSYNPRATPPNIDKIEKLKLEDCYRIYKERFADFSNATFTFVGNVDLNSFRPLLEQYLGSLPSLNRLEQAKDWNIKPLEGMVDKKVIKGLEDKATVKLYLTGHYNLNELNNEGMRAIGAILNMRLLQRLREDEGGVYSPSCNMGYSKYPFERYMLSISYGCSPTNVDKLIAITYDEIEKFKKEGAIADELQKYKAETQQVNMVQIKTNRFWLSYLNQQIQENESFDKVNRMESVLNEISLNKIKELGTKYLTGENKIRVVLLPEKKVN